MRTKKPIVYLRHIAACVSKIEEYTTGMTEERFLESPLVQDAVIRNLEIIGEATKRLDDTFRSSYPHIAWKNIAGMRDKLIHDYIGVDLWAVWGVVEDIMPDFSLQINEIISMESSHD